MKHKYTTEQREFIKNNAKGISTIDLTKLFNLHFKLDLQVKQIKAYMKNHGIRNGVNAQFKKGREPFNKGMKGVSFGGKETQFKKGHKSHNWVELGTERINADGYCEIKVADGKRQGNWKGKHLVIWEKENGPVLRGYAVIFGDSNNRNFDIENLILVTRRQLLNLNRENLIQKDVEFTKTAIIITDLKQKISERRRRDEQR